MLDTLLDARSGDRTEIAPDVEAGESEAPELRAACVALLNAIERKSIPDLIKASREVHTELHREPPFENIPEEDGE